ncbi:hypothetical protein PENARI_c007G00672 [Penicillium arizonense]|jgi:hypothetical protein|uniref:Transcription initiation factor Rrn11 n=1 Tax=Penicillium arizonense TaxID=1835702 RepID=A0A1F5LKP3_PENAI|nr:hypothetical protein PENARI_c007G00672 [Penicillium arizonense]OGE53570.1 hypothetical protein PENARI_c007G00672 [Penicillium arizonense]
MASAPSASVFSLPLPPWLQPSGTRVSQYDRQKRSAKWSEDDLHGEETDFASATESEPAGPPLVLTPNESHQYRIAGFPFHAELPGGNFPHQPAKDEPVTKVKAPGHLRALADLSPPIYPPQSVQEGNIRFQHLGVLTTILHRCMLQGDYARAGRAWGLILREEYRGFRMDVRNEARWGIGAEILLRRDQQEAPPSAGASMAPDATVATSLTSTTKGFAEAKEYYERLILNHPYMKSSPHSISSLHFYPAMFGLWVYVSQEESNTARKDIALRQEDESDGFSDDEDPETELEHGQMPRNKTATAISKVRLRELEQAQQIAARMDQLLISPPFSDSPELLELRGMVSLWIGDLFLSALVTPVDEEDKDPDRMLMDEAPGSLEARRAQRLATEKKEAEVQKSIEFFGKAKKRGRSVAYNLESLHIDDGFSV